jgi:diguanylate cyclase
MPLDTPDVFPDMRPPSVQSLLVDLRILESKYRELLTKYERLQAELAEAKSESLIDPLTCLLNRRGFKHFLTQAAASKHVMACLILDIDDFKLINDTYGHEGGDQALVQVAKYLKQCIRSTDILARWGGEEFLIAFRQTDAQGVINKFYSKDESNSRGRPKINISVMLENVGPKPVELTITFSGGVAEFKAGDDIDESIRLADRAMYSSKQAGKDVITVS